MAAAAVACFLAVACASPAAASLRPSSDPAVEAGDPGTSSTGGIVVNPDSAAGDPGAARKAGKVVTVTMDSCGVDTPWYKPWADATCLSANVGKFFFGVGQFLGNPLGAMVQFMSDNLLADPCPGNGPCAAGAQHPGATLTSILAGRPPFFNHDPGEWGTDNMYTRLWSVSLSVAGVLIALAAGMRLVRMSFDQGRIATIVPDIVPRVVAGFAGAWLSYKVLAWLAYTASDLGRLAMRAFFLNTAAGQDLGTLVSRQVGASNVPAGPAILTLLPLLASLFVLLWVLALMVVRFIVLTFCIVLAPVAASVAVYDSGNDFVRWWARMLAGAIIAPLVVGTVLGVTFSMSFNLSSGGLFGQVTAEVVFLGGLVFLARALQSLTFGAVRAGSLAGVIAAAETGLLVGSRAARMGGGLARAARGGGGGGGSGDGEARRAPTALAAAAAPRAETERRESAALDPAWLTGTPAADTEVTPPTPVLRGAVA